MFSVGFFLFCLLSILVVTVWDASKALFGVKFRKMHSICSWLFLGVSLGLFLLLGRVEFVYYIEVIYAEGVYLVMMFVARVLLVPYEMILDNREKKIRDHKKVLRQEVERKLNKREEVTDEELIEYLREHVEEQSYSPVRLPFEVELILVDRYLKVMLNKKAKNERYLWI